MKHAKHGTDKYEAIRRLQQMDDARLAPDYTGDTGLYQKLPPASDETVPVLPALVRKQAE